MAAGDILTQLGTKTSFAITLDSLASDAAGEAGRQATFRDNSTIKAPAALIHLEITLGTTPTVDTTFWIYLLRASEHSWPTAPSVVDDGAADVDQNLTRHNAPVIGVVRNWTATSATVLQKTLDTHHLGPLGPSWTILIAHNTVAALPASGHTLEYTPYWPQVQQ